MTLAVELCGIAKSFGPVVANSDISFGVRRGSIHAIIGENGAGKSTAMKMLYGVYRPDAGEIRVAGAPRAWASPSDAIAAGIGMVHQHFMLAGPETALDNILLGAEGARVFAAIPRRKARAELGALSSRYGLSLDLDAPVETLPVGVQQRIEILKLLHRRAEILILDEPTAVLTPQETGELFVNLKRLRDEGKTILIITHKLKEVMAISDEVTVFRAGRVSGTLPTREASVEKLADLMVGRKVVLQVEVPERVAPGPGVLLAEGLELDALPGGERKRLSGVSFEVRAGEVVGIAGVEGNGQSELLELLLHPRDFGRAARGSISYFGTPVFGPRVSADWRTPEIFGLGVGVIPEDRHRQALLLERPVWENFLLGLQRFRRFAGRGGWIRRDEVFASASRALEDYDVRPRSLEIHAGGLSGGNQQKLIIAREFERQPRLLIAAQPTRGVDVGAIEAIHRRIIDARTRGAGVLLVSSELDEVLALSDRILVLYNGAIAAEFARGQVTEHEIGLKMGGVGVA